MELSIECNSILDHWLGLWPESGHALDEERWFDFVKQFECDHGHSLDEKLIRDVIHEKEKAITGRVSPGFAKMIDVYIHDARVILHYLSQTTEPR